MISLIPIVVMQTVFYNLSKYYIEQKINTLTDKNLSYIQNNIESDLEYYKEILYRIDADSDLIECETKINGGDEQERESYGIRLRDELAYYTDIREEVTSITYVNESMKSVFYDKKNMSATNYFWNTFSDSEKRKMYQQIQKDNRIVFFNTKKFSYNNEQNYLYTIGIKAWNIRTGEDLGIILMSVNEKHLQDICNLQTQEKDVTPVQEYSFLVHQDGTVLSFRDKSFIGQKVAPSFENGEIDNGRFLDATVMRDKNRLVTNSVPVEGTDWMIVNLVDKDSMFYEVNALWKLTMEITVALLAVCILFVLIFSNRFYNSVHAIIKEMQKAQKGDFSAHIQPKGVSELVFISNEFNDMIQRISTLVKNLEKQNQYIFEISNRKREAEVNAIVAQINPHFLYNTLDCMNWIAIRKEEYEISKMIGSLAHILRYSIRTMNEQVSIFQAMEWVKKYLYLYQVRLNYSFQVDYQIESDVLGFKIYKLLLQPVIENAILHGFQNSSSENLLTIQIQKHLKKSLMIKITDNGAGIPEEKLKRIFSETSNRTIGLNNVRERLQIYYGDAAEITVESREHSGTQVTILLPQIQ